MDNDERIRPAEHAGPGVDPDGDRTVGGGGASGDPVAAVTRTVADLAATVKHGLTNLVRPSVLREAHLALADLAARATQAENDQAAQVKITQNVYGLLVEEKRARQDAEAEAAKAWDFEHKMMERATEAEEKLEAAEAEAARLREELAGQESWARLVIQAANDEGDRLREERDLVQRWLEREKEIAKAAEARSAQLEQAFQRIVDADFGAMHAPTAKGIARDALAGSGHAMNIDHQESLEAEVTRLRERCAQLEQAIEDAFGEQKLSAALKILTEALAGPDTPADSQEDKT